MLVFEVVVAYGYGDWDVDVDYVDLYVELELMGCIVVAREDGCVVVEWVGVDQLECFGVGVDVYD